MPQEVLEGLELVKNFCIGGMILETSSQDWLEMIDSKGTPGRCSQSYSLVQLFSLVYLQMKISQRFHSSLSSMQEAHNYSKNV